MQKEVFAVRISQETRLALEAVAASRQVKPRSLAAQMIADGLKRAGYLPKARRTQATAQA